MHFRLNKKQMAAALVVALSAITGCSKDESPEQLIAQAKQYESKGDSKAAIIQLKNALQAKPDDAAARLALGRLYLKTGDHASAEKELRRAMELSKNRAEVLPVFAKSLLLQNKSQEVLDVTASTPPDATLLSLRGDAFLLLQKLDDSRQAFDSALKLEPTNSDALNGLARHALIKNDVDTAVRLADSAISHNPSDVDALMFRADLDKAMGKPDAARATYDKVLKVNPDTGAAYLQKAYLDIDQKKFDAARADIAALRKVAPGNVLAYHAQALLEFTEGKYKEALASIQGLLKVAPDHMPSQLLAGATQFTLGSLPQAEQHLKRYIESDPGNIYARKMLASVYVGLNQPQDALAQLKTTLDTSTDTALLNIGGRAYLNLKQYDNAIATYERAIGLKPADTQLHVGLGLAKMSKGDSTGAIKAMRKGLELSAPTAVDAGIVLGMTHLQLRQYSEALAVINQMVQRVPNSALLHNLKGGALLGLNDRAAARAAFEKSMQLEPSYFTAVNNLARMDIADKKPEAARQRYQAFVDKNAGSAESMLALADLALAENKQADATKWLEKAHAAEPKLSGPALRLTQQYLAIGEKRKALTLISAMQVADPENPMLLDMLGKAHAANDNKIAALEAYGRLAVVKPRTSGITARLAAAYEELGERDLAADVLRKAHTERPDDVAIKLARIAVEVRRGNHEQAIMFAREVQARPASKLPGLIVEAEVREAQQKPDLAIPLYQRALQESKGSSPLRIKLANAYRQAGRPDEALRLVQQWRNERPKDNAIGVYLGELYVAHKKYPAAIETFTALLKELPNNGVILNNLALAYQATGDARALATAEQALKALPQSGAAMDTLGWMLVDKGDLARGLPLLKKASAAEPGAADIRYHLAAAHARNNDKAAARKELETLLAEKSDVAQAEQARALLKQL
ncbi:XrtA/PEP-CTERM system TPR-repeat protein PrsT [Pseudoduganella umbonata]|uniref:PEP-CTERM system TPR-repeat protein PrsT n=1 Tax=Pseudoduganella umbonata TaxID=864828 RepID=A0A4P8HVV8_9BURK|nr:XrtA/PEP-CTERM system TPR-repeat protein PrsT [Pseudoduganella umbonata]MBB3223847.1 putative PEP-CTERM system TPR-repeat lipoprotein [Pseudoduganella umbonata]QCP12740.1 PEP-CTERM system TPR-repeat protein PrsT [Pseudoduganella umbonata]